MVHSPQSRRCDDDQGIGCSQVNGDLLGEKLKRPIWNNQKKDFNQCRQSWWKIFGNNNWACIFQHLRKALVE